MKMQRQSKIHSLGYLSVIMPVYNERKTIEGIIERVKAVPLPKEIIIVDDFSTDGTREGLGAIKDSEVKVLYHRQNQGKGSAIRTALAQVQGDIVIIQDADLEYDPGDYPRLLQPIIEGKTDVVYGSRFLGEKFKLFGRGKTSLPHHYLGNRLLTIMTNLLYFRRITDMETGYKVFRSETIKSISLRCRRFDFEPEITAKLLKKGCRILELPINYRPRSFKEGKKINWVDGLAAAYYLVKYRFLD